MRRRAAPLRTKICVGTRLWRMALGCTVACLVWGGGCSAADTGLTVGSKKFTESVVLGEILSAMAKDTGVEVNHRRELGGTRVVFNAMKAGDIDAYVDYTGTVAAELVSDAKLSAADVAGLRAALLEQGVKLFSPLGFNNTYALAMRRDRAAELKIQKASDLVNHPTLTFAFGNEFLERQDGWRALAAAYQLPQKDVRGMDHDLAYRAVADGSRDVLDVYTTDAQIAALDLVVLEDDRAHFPDYRALILMRTATAARLPEVVAQWEKLTDKIQTASMAKMNKRAQLDREPEGVVAGRFVETHFGIAPAPVTETSGFWLHTKDHLVLVGISLLLALLVALPLGVAAAKIRVLRTPVLGAVSVFQTIPSLALLVVLIPFLGVGAAPAIVALFVYSLLPIVRNTVAGLDGVEPALDESARALGLPAKTRLLQIELPLALPSILAGIKTAAVINVGTATLGAIIGAGGYGQPILTGIRLGSTSLILQGAIPAAVLALLVSAVFDGVERVLVSPGLRASSRG